MPSFGGNLRRRMANHLVSEDLPQVPPLPRSWSPKGAAAHARISKSLLLDYSFPVRLKLTIEQKSAMYVLIPREYVAPTSRQGTQKNHDTVKEASGKAAGFHAPTTSTRRATGCSRSASEEAVRDILGLSDDGCESGKNSASPSPSSSSGDAHPKTYQAGAEAASFSDTEDSLQDNQDVRPCFLG